jgi:hypothetical protein
MISLFFFFKRKVYKRWGRENDRGPLVQITHKILQSFSFHSSKLGDCVNLCKLWSSRIKSSLKVVRNSVKLAILYTNAFIDENFSKLKGGYGGGSSKPWIMRRVARTLLTGMRQGASLIKAIYRTPELISSLHSCCIFSHTCIYSHNAGYVAGSSMGLR